MIRLLLVIGIRFYRDGLVTTLQRNGNITVVGTATDSQDALTQVLRLEPDVVLLDAGIDGSRELARALYRSVPGCKVVVAAIKETADVVIEWAEVGIAGFVSRDETLDHLVATITSVANGELPCSPRIGALLLQRVGALAVRAHTNLAGMDRAISLTPRETEILALIARGLSNKQIAREFGISVATTKNHVHNILNKLNLHRRSDAVLFLRGKSPSTSEV